MDTTKIHLAEYYTTRRLIQLNLISGGSSLVSIIIGSSLMKFYTDIIGLSPAMYGVIFLIFSIWNGVNDIIIAYYSDRFPYHQKHGKYGRFIRWSVPVIAVTVIALLFVSPDWPEIIIAIYLLVMLLIYEAAKTLLDVSFNAFRINTFLTSHKRAKVAVIATYINMIPMFVGGMVPVWFLTGEFSRMTVVTFFTACILFGILLIYIGSRFVKEDPEFYKNMQVARSLRDITQLLVSLIKDKVFLLYGIGFLLVTTATGNYMSGYLYYMDNVLEVSELQATIPDILTGVVQIISLPFILKAIKKHGIKQTYIAGMLFAVIGHAALSLQTGYYFVSAMYLVILFGYGFGSALLPAWGGLLTDHIEISTGNRQPALISSLMAIVMIPAASFQPLILSTLLEVTNYNGAVKHQTAEVVNAIRLGTGIIPAAILLVGLIVLMFVPFGFQREHEITKHVQERHGLEENPVAVELA
ncbi:MAG: MFS transporter [Anaerolineae bacterium]|nr:MFS transporter [Anaerolineae bacterium]